MKSANQVILDGIERAGQEQIQRIEFDAKKQIDQLQQDAEDEGGLQKRRILTDGRARLNREQAIIEQQATVQGLQIHADARQRLIEDVLENVQGNLSDLRKRKDYPSILSQLAEESVATLKPSLMPDQRITLHFDKRDKELVKKAIRNNGIKVVEKFDISTFGGCNGETDDGLVIVKNTIESRIEHAKPDLQQKLSLFFEEKILPS